MAVGAVTGAGADGGKGSPLLFVGLLQLRGSGPAVWLDVLPPLPREVMDANGRAVAQALADSYGGTVR